MLIDGFEEPVTPEHLRVIEERQWEALEVEREAGTITVEQEDLIFFYWFRRHHGESETRQV